MPVTEEKGKFTFTEAIFEYLQNRKIDLPLN